MSEINQSSKIQNQRGEGSVSSSNPSNASEGKSKSGKVPQYSSERVIGSGSFGVVFKAVCVANKEVVAIKKVREDRRYKNRELQMMKVVKHPNIVTLRDCFYSRVNQDVFLNLVMEFIPETLYVTIRNHAKAGQTIPFLLIKVYSYQICRAISYCHSRGICHRDIKPQNLLLDPDTHTVKICDFGSAKALKEGEPNVSYICSRYYRAPELIFESSSYRTTIDVWSVGCVIAELFLTTPLFQGERSVDQLVEIIKVLGTPSRQEILGMNPNYTNTNFPSVKALPWKTVFANVKHQNKAVPEDAIDLLSKLLVFMPSDRLDCFNALAHPYFDELRQPQFEIAGCKKGPELFSFTPDEIELAKKRKIVQSIIPKQYWVQFNIQSKTDSTNEKTSTENGSVNPKSTLVNETVKSTATTQPSAQVEQQYVMSRVQEIAEQKPHERRSLQKKTLSGQLQHQ